MINALQHILDVAKGKIPAGMPRSNKWPAARLEHLKVQPACALCDASKKIQVHHKRPFHLRPELELDPTNLITLCEDDSDGVNCHLFLGHLGNFKSFNETVEEDAKYLSNKLATRP